MASEPKRCSNCSSILESSTLRDCETERCTDCQDWLHSLRDSVLHTLMEEDHLLGIATHHILTPTHRGHP